MNKKFASRLYKVSRIQLAVFLAVIILTYFVPAIGVTYVVYHVSRIMPIKMSMLEGVVLSFLLFIVANAFIYQLFSAFSIHPDISIVSVVYVILSAFFGFKTPIKKQALLPPGGLVCIIAAVVAFSFLFVPIAKLGGGPIVTLHLISSGEDNASHFALFKHAYINDGYAYSKSVYDQGLIPNLVNYPQGSEFTSAWLAKSLLGNQYENNNYVLVQAYYALSAFFFSLLVFIICLISFRLYGAVKQRISWAQSVAIVVLSFLLLTIGPLLSLMGRGFHSQIAGYLFLFAILYILILPTQAKQKPIALLGALALWGGVCVSWWFLAPIAAVPIAYYGLINRASLKKKYIVPALAILLLSIYPILLDMTSPIKNTGINQHAGLDILGIISFCIFLISSCVLLLKFVRGKALILLITLFAWGGFTLAIGAYQQLTIGRFEYYFYKSVYTLIPFGAVGIMYLALHVLGIFSSRSKKVDYLLAASVLAITMLGLMLFKPVYPRVYANDWFRNSITENDFSTILAHSQNGKYEDLVVVGGCDTGSTYLMNRWAGALFLSEKGERSGFIIAQLHDDINAEPVRFKELENTNSSVFFLVKEDCLNPRVKDQL